MAKTQVGLFAKFVETGSKQSKLQLATPIYRGNYRAVRATVLRIVEEMSLEVVEQVDQYYEIVVRGVGLQISVTCIPKTEYETKVGLSIYVTFGRFFRPGLARRIYNTFYDKVKENHQFLSWSRDND